MTGSAGEGLDSGARLRQQLMQCQGLFQPRGFFSLRGFCFAPSPLPTLTQRPLTRMFLGIGLTIHGARPPAPAAPNPGLPDAASRRMAAGVPFLPLFSITPDALKDAAWRRQVAWSYL